MFRLGVLVLVPLLAKLGALGDVEDGTALLLLAAALVGAVVEVTGNAHGRRKKPSVIFFGLVAVFTFASQVMLLLHPHVARAHAAPPQQPSQPRQEVQPLLQRLQQAPAQVQPPPPGQQQPQAPVEAPRLKQLLLLSRGRSEGGVQRPDGAPTMPPMDLAARFGGTVTQGGSARTISIVLPCAEERSNALNTVDRFCSRTPEGVLAEIIVVDDGSQPPLATLFAEDARRLDQNRRCNLRILRHEVTTGLMAAKLTGGKAATGDVIGFFDCHCSPKQGWEVEILKQVSENPRRMVVPAITDLDLDTFDEKKDSGVNAKCYLTFDADFKWFDDESKFIPTISGGLVAMGREWFNLTGGFDEEMHGWGGENLDQSLRAWLCGGEITVAKSSRIAHMWRTGDPRTGAHYFVRAKATNNRGRVAAAWFDAFLPVYRGGAVKESEVSNFDAVKKRLGCRPFVYFLYRFRRVYIEGGVIPKKVFGLQEKASSLCVARVGGATTAQSCSKTRGDQKLQLGNVDRDTGRCCSGIRNADSNDCLDYIDAQGPHWYPCDVSGQNGNQQYRLTDDGRVKRPNGECLYIEKAQKKIKFKSCHDLLPGEGVFERVHEIEPKTYTLYKSELERNRFATELPDLPDN